MLNTFLFIIPLTPESHLTSLRKELRKWCMYALENQNYPNWKALIIGEQKPIECEDERYIHIKYEGVKELKLQIASQFILENKIETNYIIRLDDDDCINPNILSKYAKSNADAIVDAKHWFLEWNSMSVSSEFRSWFPNTFFHRFDHAMSAFGKLAKDTIPILNDKTFLLENNHAKMHEYYFNRNIVFEENAPIYLRVLNKDSITSNAGQSYEEYLSYFGLWNHQLPSDFNFLPQKNEKLNIIKKNIINKLKYKLHQSNEAKKFLKKFNIK